MFGYTIREGDEEIIEKQKEYAEMYKNFCKHLLNDLNDEYLRVESAMMTGCDVSNIVLRYWKRQIINMAEPIRKVYKCMNEYLIFSDDEFLGRKYID